MTAGSSRRQRRKAPATLVTDLYYRPASRATRALVALLSGIVVLLAGLAVAVWLAGRWMVAPLARLSAAGRQGRRRRPDDRRPAQPDRRDREHRAGSRGHDSRARRDRATTSRSRRGETVPRHQRRPRPAHAAVRAARTPAGDRLPAGQPGRPPRAGRSESRRARTTDRQPVRLHPRRLHPTGAPARSRRRSPTCSKRSTAGLEHTARLRDNTFDLDGDQALGVIVDRDRFKRALTNILDNALRYSPPGAPIHLSWAAADESTVQITIRDHGPGIDPNLLPHIFEPGIRGAPAAGSPDDGAGLGLTIAKRLLEHQHATLTVGNQQPEAQYISLTLQRALSGTVFEVSSATLRGVRGRDQKGPVSGAFENSGGRI